MDCDRQLIYAKIMQKLAKVSQSLLFFFNLTRKNPFHNKFIKY